jgi:hypothetical protein
MIKSPFTPLKLLASAGIAWQCLIGPAFGQSAAGQAQQVSLQDLSFFREPGKTWQLAGDVSADPYKAHVMKPEKGTGILVNLPSKKNKGADLLSTLEHGDVDLELDYMMAKGSNSGIYLQGRYELQLEDTWAKPTASSANNGGIYERWDESRPDGQKGYEGYAPRQNVSRAPGVWQHLKISFQAPRFDAAGKKVENAKMLRVELNGVTIHEDVELLGATRGAMGEEKATGPLRLQGDHGAVAFRNIKITTFPNNRPEAPARAGNGNNNRNEVAPILVNAPVNTILRSFMDVPGGEPVTHGVNVGSPANVHYTYDMDRGALVQVWRGGFLNATPMWHSRGNGMTVPQGSLQRFGKPALTIAKRTSDQSAWVADTAGAGYRAKGYVLDAQDRPTFRYLIYGATVNDAVRPMDNGQGFSREITVQNGTGDLYARLAAGSDIEQVDKNKYLVDGKSYYLQLEETSGAKPLIRDANGGKELIVPVRGKLSYSVLF